MIVAVYTITKNEEQFIEKWVESSKDAEYQYIIDTGSTDATVSIARDLGCMVHEIKVSPWRFDDARNASLALISENVDWCIALDADEILLPGWRQELAKLDSSVTRPRYKYVWSWNPDGSEGLVYGGEKIHRRHGYRWKHPVHEILTPTGEEVQAWCDLEIHHFPDDSKPRSQYLPLLEVAAKESPDCDRTAHYLGREYIFNEMYEEAANELKRHLSLSSSKWRPERAASMRYLAQCPKEPTEHWLLSACAEAPDRRESWVALADHYYENNLWAQCYAAGERASWFESKPLDYLCEAFAWDGHVYDITAIAAWNMGLYDKANWYGSKALEADPENDRLAQNMEHYSKGA